MNPRYSEARARAIGGKILVASGRYGTHGSDSLRKEATSALDSWAPTIVLFFEWNEVDAEMRIVKRAVNFDGND